jgi:hypothetical protein
MVEAHLSWCEYFQGKWMTPESGGFAEPIRQEVAVNFKNSDVFVHVTKDDAGDGTERFVQINLEFDYTQRAFRLRSKQSRPRDCVGDASTQPPYNTRKKANHHTGDGGLTVCYVDTITTEFQNGVPFASSRSERLPHTILADSLDDPFALVISRDALTPAGVYDSEFFYQNDQHLFFVEPLMSETLLDDSIGWGVDSSATEQLEFTLWFDRPVHAAAVREPPRPVEVIEGHAVDPLALYSIGIRPDWVTAPDTVLILDGQPIGAGGMLERSPGRNERWGHGAGGHSTTPTALRRGRRGRINP